MTPHKHAEMIKAWADGAEIEGRNSAIGPWHLMDPPNWNPYCEYRIRQASPKKHKAFLVVSPHGFAGRLFFDALEAKNYAIGNQYRHVLRVDIDFASLFINITMEDA